MEAMTQDRVGQSGTDNPAAVLSGKVDGLAVRFDELGRRTEDGFKRLDARVEKLAKETNTRLDGIQRSMFMGVIVLSGAYLAGFAALVGLIATQL